MKTLILILLTMSQLPTLASARDIIIEINGQKHACRPIDDTTPGNPLACIDAAYRGPFSRDESISLCEGAIDEAPAQCALRAYRGIYSREECLQLCTGAFSEGPIECADLAYSGPFSRDETLSLCAHPRATRAVAQCALEAYRGPYSREQSIKLCRVQNGRGSRTKGLKPSFSKLDEELLIKEANLKAMSLGEYK